MTEAAPFSPEGSAVNQLSRSLAGSPHPELATWLDEVERAVQRLTEELRARRQRDKEFDSELLRVEPRLTHSATRLASDSSAIEQEITELTDLLRSRAGDPSVEDIRDRGRRLVAHVVRHLHADVVLAHEAFSADVGGGE